MPNIYTTETFRVPKFFRIMCQVLAVVMLVMAGYAIAWVSELPVLLIFSLVFLLLAWSMYAYSRQTLTLSDTAIVFKGGWKLHDIDWHTITKIDMAEVGKYDDPQITLYYPDRKLTIAHSLFLKRQFKEIVLLLEMKLPAELFTAKYQQLRAKLSTKW
jgi:hypothetical protein